MMWIDQTITLNDEVVQRLQRASKILHRGEKFHQSMRLSYLIVAFFIVIGLIVLIELLISRRRPVTERHLIEEKKRSESTNN